MEDILNEIFEAYLKATGKNPTDGSIRIGEESDWYCYKAKERLQTDPTGLLSILTMKQAFKAFIRDHSYTIEKLLDLDWCIDWYTEKKKYIAVEDLLNSGKVGQIYDAFIELIIKHVKVLGKPFTYEEIHNVDKIEDVLVSSVEEFRDKYVFRHEKFSDGETKINKDARILSTLYRFDYLKQFVDSLKQTPEDNFICLALIERTYEDITDEYYDKNFDSFFAYGVKNNGVVYIVSDRTVFDSPEGAYKSRNPGRSFNHKVEGSWLPYYKLKEIKNNSTNQLLLTYNGEQKGNKIVDLFDTEAIIYTTLIMTLIYDKYFCNELEDKGERYYFSSEIKLLPDSNCKALALTNELQLPTIRNNIDATTWNFDDKIYTNSMYDYLLDVYPLPEEKQLSALINFIGDKEQAIKTQWWQIRKTQSDHIKECLTEDYQERYKEIEDWQREQILKNISSIIDYMLTNEDRDGYETYKSVHSGKGAKDKCLWEAFRDGDPLDTYKLKTVENKDKFIPHYKSYKTIFSPFGTIECSSYGYNTFMWFADDNNRRVCEIELILRSHTDLEKFFNLHNSELPGPLRRHFYSRSGPYTALGWKPYTGNSILNFTDPMNDIRDPFEDVGCRIYIYTSKSKLKELGRKVSGKSWYEDQLILY